MLTATQLQKILENDCIIPEGLTAIELSPQLAEWLGSPDSDLRENSLSVLGEWVLNGSFDAAQLKALAEQMAANLSRGLGEKDTDSVFLRAFSALILGAIISHDQTCSLNNAPQAPFLQPEDIKRWLETGLVFLRDEEDLRGYDLRKGWLHALAHAADLLRSFAIHRHLDTFDLQRILESIASKVTHPLPFLLQNDEDERLAAAVYAVLLRNQIDPDFFRHWLNSFLQTPDQKPWKGTFDNPGMNHARIHTKAFLRSLYFMLLFGMRSPLGEAIFKQRPARQEQLLAALTHTLNEFYRGRFYPETLPEEAQDDCK